MKKSVLLFGLLVGPLVACELVADFDRTKIPSTLDDAGAIADAAPVLDVGNPVDAAPDVAADTSVTDAAVVKSDAADAADAASDAN
jgi:hypothetical protein